MAFIQKSDIIAYHVLGGTNCPKCYEATKPEIPLELDAVITKEKINDHELLFCDSCQKQI